MAKMTQKGLVEKVKKTIDMLVSSTNVPGEQLLQDLQTVQGYVEYQTQALIQRGVTVAEVVEEVQEPVAEAGGEEPTDIEAVPPKRGRRRKAEAHTEVEDQDQK